MKNKILTINLGNFGSTGRIVRKISAAAKNQGYDVFSAFPRDEKELPFENNDIIISTALFKKISQRICRYAGYKSCGAFFTTIRFLRKIKKINPVLLHLHNLHDSYLNLPLLFSYVKRHDLTVVWTLHDCWAFTGQCPHFAYAGCDRWKSGCGDCVQFRDYPETAYDNTKVMYRMKKKWFSGIRHLTIVTPSRWLADLVKESFLKEYPVEVINNGIDLDVFWPRKSDFRRKYNIPSDRHILLGVAFDWDKKKGLDDFVALSKRLGDSYQLVLVGTSERVDALLPDNVISIHRTLNQTELAEIYTAADLFVNFTLQDTFPTVNIEALACGTPVLTYRTGGSPEILDESCGSVVPKGDLEAALKEIVSICEEKKYSENACIQRAKCFDQNEKYHSYVELYDRILREKNE